MPDTPVLCNHPGSLVPERVLVTGSRTFGATDIVSAALGRSQAGRSPQSMLLVHGQCDPRDPWTGDTIPWRLAVERPVRDWLTFRGADWLADRLATQMRWAVERHPAAWARYGAKAGPRRNSEMTGAGAGGGHAFFSAGALNQGTLDCATKMAQAAIPLLCWCDQCGPVPSPDGPCARHLPRWVLS